MVDGGMSLSPRVRGNQLQRPDRAGRQGSIPACAGKPAAFGAGSVGNRVYPRVCGETTLTSLPDTSARGLSPRVRGNPLVHGKSQTKLRSIPACAGEPRPCTCRAGVHWVYPRVCGGTRVQSPIKCATIGLSPRVRGNRPCSIRHLPCTRSIPACAGEPSMDHSSIATRPFRGLSPRVRGNQRYR